MDSQTRQKIIDTGIGSMAYSTGIVPTPSDHILTLSTCTGDGHDDRWVVQGVLEEG